MKALLLAAGLALSSTALALPAHAETTALPSALSGHYQMDKTHASLTWKIQHLGLAYYTARFTDLDIDLTFDAANPEKSTVSATINPAQVRTDYPYPEKEDFDTILATDAKWFNSTAFPKITFTATGLTLTGDKTGTMTGDLSFLGVTRPITLAVTLSGYQEKHPFAGIPALGFSATTTLKRSDWGLKTLLPLIGDDVQIIIEAEFMKPKT
ncbi:MAG: polyisoprenoid-binding protein [Robiginitomaculum sp.]|nr:MAG: polyisoprenoid-binding protein [Robiginitomaculum sp.]